MTLLLLFFALILPVVGAVGLRAFAARMPVFQQYAATSLIFGVAIASVLLLARGDVGSIQIGGLTLLLPSAPLSEDIDLPPLTIVPAPDDATTAPVNATAAPATPTSAPTVAPTSAPTAIPPTVAPTSAPTAIPPTVAPTSAPTAIPPTAVPAAKPSTYTMKPGDTLRSIAQQFNVSVQDILRVNNWTPAQGDSLPVGQELKLP